MTLYNIPRGSRIKAETSNDKGKLGDYIIFNRLDRAFSHCTIKDTEKTCHLSANQELELLADGNYSLL
jgi:hypothetical protein